MRLAPEGAVIEFGDGPLAREQRAVDAFLRQALEPGAPPLVRVLLFGSRARGEHDAHSDVDLLLLCDLAAARRPAAAAWHTQAAHAVSRQYGVEVRPWTLTLPELARGRRTPMLIDALEDGLTLWPPGAPPVRLPFTHDDARFCAACLFDWVADGGRLVVRQLQRGDWHAAAQRTRDDIVRMATAGLLLDGSTRHRRRGTLRRFERRFLDTGRLSPRVRPALDWAARAFPADEGRGHEPSPVTPYAVGSAPRGNALARRLSWYLLPLADALIAGTRD